jgi:pimeloyl-ACP methyl ester carboxylesterase
MITVTSTDGTSIAVDRTGSGAPVVIVNGALGTRDTDASLATLLAPHFTVYTYDRRGRGDSGDAAQYDVAREVDDLRAVVAAAGGGPAHVYGTSSGANLAIEAASRGVAIDRLALWEPNLIVDDVRPPLPRDYTERLTELVASSRRGDAVEYFMTAAVGMPAEFVAPMRQMPMWPAMEAVAHTLRYDGEVVADTMTGTPPPADRWPSVSAAILVVDGGQTPWLTAGADALAAILPQARRRTIPGQPHNVSPDAIAAVLHEFFAGQPAADAREPDLP